MLLKHLPKFFIPANFKTARFLRVEDCKTWHHYPWQHSGMHTYQHFKLLTIMNERMVQAWLAEQTNFHQKLSLYRDAVAVHLRCSDNLNNNVERYGLIPFSDIKRILEDIYTAQNKPSPVVIYSDTHLKSFNGEVCTRSLLELEEMIGNLPGYSSSDLTKLKTSAAETYVLLHTSRYTICSLSTFCFYAAGFSSLSHAFIPDDRQSFLHLPQFGLPNTTFFKTQMLRPKEAEPIQDFMVRLQTSSSPSSKGSQPP